MVDIIPTIFGTDDIPDYEALKRRRAIAAALAARQRGFPKTLGEGLTYFGESLGEMLGDMRLRRLEQAQKGHDTRTRTGGPAEPNFAEDRPPGTPAPRTTPPATTTPPAVTTPPPATSPFPDPQAPPGGWGAGADAAPAAAPVGAPNPVIHDQGAAAPFADRFAASFDDTSAPIPPELSPAAQVANRFPEPAPQVATTPRPDVAAMVPPASDLQSSLTNVAARPAPDPRAPRPGAMPAIPQEPVTQQSAFAPATPLAATAAPEGDAWGRYSRGLAGIESGGAKDPYRLLGAVTKSGDRAYGKYQVMGRNIPAWTEAALGVRMTPEQFRNSPEAQEATAKHRFMNYVSKYGPEGASRAWYAGEGGMKNLGATDIHGRLTVAGYGKDFLRRIGEGGGGDTTQVASRGNGASPYRNVAVRPEADPRAEIAEIAALNPQVLAGQAPPGGPETVADADSEPGTRQMITQALLGTQRPPQAQQGADPARIKLASLDPMAGIGSARPAAPMNIPVAPPPIPAAPPAPAAVPVPSDPAAPVQVAQAQLQPGIRPDMIPGAFPPPRLAPPPADTSQGIQRAPDMLPSQEPIPPGSTGEVPKPGAPPPEPRPLGRSQYEDYWIGVHNDRRSSDQLKAEAAAKVQAAQAARLKEDERRWQNYGHLRTKYEADVKASQDWERGGREKARQEEAERRIRIEKGQQEAQTAPIERRIKELQEQRDRATTPLQIQEAQVKLDQAQATLEETRQRIAIGRAPPREKIGERILERQQDGSWKDVTPDEQMGHIKLTEQQARGVKFFERSNLARKQGGSFAAMAGLKDTVAGWAPIGGNYWTSSEYQLQNSSADAWIENTLRDISGAAIRTEEYPAQKKIYFPQPGDGPDLIKAKAERRANQERSLYDSLGTAKPIADKYLEGEKAKEDKAAADWARSNPNDPRAIEILRRQGGR